MSDMSSSLDHLLLGKLILQDIFLSIKQKHCHAWILGPQTLFKLICLNQFPKYQTEPWSSLAPRTL